MRLNNEIKIYMKRELKQQWDREFKYKTFFNNELFVGIYNLLVN